MPTVLHHQRLPDHGHVSIERLFEGIRHELAPRCLVQASVSPYPSRGLLPRLKNLRAASKLKADIHHIVGDVHYLGLALPREKFVLTIHDCAALERHSGWRREILRQLWFVQPMKRAAVVTTISEATKEELRRWVGNLADNVLVIPNCVRGEFQPDPKRFNAKGPVVLQVGTGWNKNVERVAKALRGTPCRLEIVGQLSVTQKDALTQIGVSYSELGRVTDAELVDAYKRCDLVVFASLYEGFGLPILEAQAVGRPVVTSNHGATAEAAGGAACLVDPTDVDQIRSAVTRIREDARYRDELVEMGLKNVAKYQPDVIASRYAELYDSLTEAVMERI